MNDTADLNRHVRGSAWTRALRFAEVHGRCLALCWVGAAVAMLLVLGAPACVAKASSNSSDTVQAAVATLAPRLPTGAMSIPTRRAIDHRRGAPTLASFVLIQDEKCRESYSSPCHFEDERFRRNKKSSSFNTVATLKQVQINYDFEQFYNECNLNDLQLVNSKPLLLRRGFKLAPYIISAILEQSVNGANNMNSTITVSSAAELMTALAGATGGETILLTAGNYGDLNLWSQKQPFVHFASEVTIKSADPGNPASFSSTHLTGVSNLTFDGVKFDYHALTGAATNVRPFEISSSDHITILNSTFDGDLASGLSAEDNGYGTGFALFTSASQDIRIENNEFYNWYRAGVFAGTKDLVVKGNNVHSISSDGFDFAQVNNVLIEDNHIHDFAVSPTTTAHLDMIQFWTSGTTAPSTDIVIRDNFLNSGGGHWTQSIFMRNEMVDAFGSGPEMYYKNITIENNVIYNSFAHGITVGETNGLNIQNNTILYNQDSNSDGTGGLPTITLAEKSLTVTVTGNILPQALNFTPAPGWTVANNLQVQYGNPEGTHYVGELFVNALAGASATLADLKAILGGTIDQLNVGASQTHFDPQPLSDVGFITDNAKHGLHISTHVLDASHIYGPTGAVDTTDAEVAWSFGDGTSGSGLVGKHTYKHAGTYDATAVVTLADGQIVTINKTIEVQAPLALRANFNQTSGDLSDIANAVTVGSKVTYESVGSDKAVRLNSDHIAYHVNSELLNNSQFTVTADFKKDVGLETIGGKLIYFADSFIIGVDADSVYAALLTDQGTQWITANHVGIQNSDWHRVALTFSGHDGAAILYVDGTEVAHLNGLDGAIQIGSVTQNFNLGDPNGSGSFSGLIDNVEFWKGAMSPDQLQTLTLPGKQGMNWDDQAIKVVGSSGADTLNGGSHNDTIIGFNGRDNLTGHGGADTILSGGGNDTLNGDSGRDVLKGGGGNDKLSGGIWNDTLIGGTGNDHLYGDSGNDRLLGSAGDDSLFGNAGNDTLLGGNGSDVLNGGWGNDVMTGGHNGDTFVFDNNFGHDTITDFSSGNGEHIDLSAVTGIANISDLVAHHLQTDAGTGFALIVDGTNSILLEGITVADIGIGHVYSGHDFIF